MDSSPPFTWQFNLGRIPVLVEPNFWVMTAMFGLMGGGSWQTMLSWVAVVFVSVLMHEIGHALMAMGLGCDVAGIRLYMGGGLTYFDRALSRWRDVAVSAAGPLTGFLFGGLMYAVYEFIPPKNYMGYVVLRQLMWVNFGWGIINLLPVPPLDGGHIARGVLGPSRQRIALWLGVLTAGAVVALALSIKAFFITFMFGMYGYQCWQALQVTRDIKPLEPVKVAEIEPDALARGWQALRSGHESEAARLGHLALSAAKPGEESNAARDLLAWVALAEGNARAAVSHLEKVQPPEAARPYSLAMAYEAAGLHERALPHALAALEKERTEALVALAARLLVKAQRLDEAERTVREFSWKAAAKRDTLLADVAVARGDFGAAAALHASVFEASGDAEAAYQAARNHARAGQGAQSSEWLKRALEAGYDDYEELARDPALAEARSAPEIAERIARRGKGVA
ncbi:MAG TPA: M50 family metallopeptidase [Archangium sp.]|uniref:M50 family metallopeptidase n=1 Tax=Archangium sp. TaxID=1872627 RepID=UPI002E344382|nr:M50 family metallopeptidase [Archangium sp.]HEX5753512.1 M50 family metallopeptidase [Archangium sp.]